jgi:hypothetical protein
MEPTLLVTFMPTKLVETTGMVTTTLSAIRQKTMKVAILTSH